MSANFKGSRVDQLSGRSPSAEISGQRRRPDSPGSKARRSRRRTEAHVRASAGDGEVDGSRTGTAAEGAVSADTPASTPSKIREHREVARFWYRLLRFRSAPQLMLWLVVLLAGATGAGLSQASHYASLPVVFLVLLGFYVLLFPVFRDVLAIGTVLQQAVLGADSTLSEEEKNAEFDAAHRWFRAVRATAAWFILSPPPLFYAVLFFGAALLCHFVPAQVAGALFLAGAVLLPGAVVPAIPDDDSTNKLD
jgi:hypothetical protein